MKKITIYYFLGLLSLLINSIFGFDLQQFKTDNNIVLEADLSGDRNIELISKLDQPNYLLNIYYKSWGKYIKITADKSAGVDPNLKIGVAYYFVLNDTGKKLLVAYLSLSLPNKEEDFECGNLILMYKYDNKKLKLTKKYYSFYDPIIGSTESNKVTDDEATPLGENMFDVLKTDISENNLLMQCRGRFYLLNNKGELRLLNSEITADQGFTVFRVINDDVQILINNTLWSEKNGNLGDIGKVENIGPVESVKLDDKKDILYIIHVRDNKKIKTYVEFNIKDNTTKNIKEEVLGDFILNIPPTEVPGVLRQVHLKPPK